MSVEILCEAKRLKEKKKGDDFYHRVHGVLVPAGGSGCLPARQDTYRKNDLMKRGRSIIPLRVHIFRKVATDVEWSFVLTAHLNVNCYCLFLGYPVCIPRGNRRRTFVTPVHTGHNPIGEHGVTLLSSMNISCLYL